MMRALWIVGVACVAIGSFIIKWEGSGSLVVFTGMSLVAVGGFSVGWVCSWLVRS